jgi:hypothetical protein
MTGSSSAIHLSELPAAEARAIFDRFVAGQPDRLASFIAEVRRREGPAEALDFSLESLEPLWRWFLAEHRPRRWFGGPHRMPTSPVADATMRGASPPWWYDFHPQFAHELGPYVAQLVTGLSEYVFACALHASPASRWALGTGRSYAYYQHPVFQLEGRGERDYAMVIVVALQGLRGERNEEPHALRRHLEQWIGMDPAYEAEMERLARPVRAFEVAAIDHPRFTHQVSFADDAAQRGERRIARLVEQLAETEGVEAAVHEDREIVLVRAPGLSMEELDSAVADLWARRRARSHVNRS